MDYQGESTSYLEKIGKQVFRVSDLKAGDVVGKPRNATFDFIVSTRCAWCPARHS